MSELNIESLFRIETHNSGNIDVESLFFNAKNVSKFDSKILLNRKQEMKKKLNEQYKNIYDVCCRQIKSTNNVGITNMIFKMPEYSKLVNYSSENCSMFVKTELEKQKIKVITTTPTILFIDWEDLDENMH